MGEHIASHRLLRGSVSSLACLLRSRLPGRCDQAEGDQGSSSVIELDGLDPPLYQSAWQIRSKIPSVQ